jgi:hypothetical protein
MAWQKK